MLHVLQTVFIVGQGEFMVLSKYPTAWSTVLLEKLIVTQGFMKPQGSLPCSRKPATGAYPEAYFFDMQFNIILPSMPLSPK
jgi:hypothetical protein